jgi:hypothetical protein
MRTVWMSMGLHRRCLRTHSHSDSHLYPHPDKIYISLLSSLAKAILLQAETEVTASKSVAVLLAIVTKNLLSGLPHFEGVLLAKLIQDAGGWGVPISIPQQTSTPTARTPISRSTSNPFSKRWDTVASQPTRTKTITEGKLPYLNNGRHRRIISRVYLAS